MFGKKPATDPAPHATDPTAPSVRQRRRPALAALGLALAAVFALTGAWLFSQGGQTQPVVAVKAAITAGQQITAAQLGTVDLPPNTGLTTIDGTEMSTLVGKYATTNLPAGTIITATQVTTTLTPPAGKSIVGIALKPSQMPSRGFTGGDRIQLVVTTGAGSAGTSAVAPGTHWAGTVVCVGPPSDDQTVTVDVQVDSALAVPVASAAGAGNLAAVLDPTTT